MSQSADELRRKIDPNRLPSHVAIIMDGNGRWAQKRHLPRLFGHRQGAKTVREIVEAAGDLGIKVLTLYAFSTENWLRPRNEIGGLMRLLKQHLRGEVSNLNKNHVRLETIGDIRRLPPDVQEELERTRRALADNTGLRLVLALNYGGRQDIVQACNRAIADGRRVLDEAGLAHYLQTAGMPDPDLLIRTSGEIRVSNFLLWQIAYAEMHITPVLWPDFKKQNFYQALLDYQARDRRYGAVE
jgi:undecaprenyl diphosphate synthase